MQCCYKNYINLVSCFIYISANDRPAGGTKDHCWRGCGSTWQELRMSRCTMYTNMTNTPRGSDSPAVRNLL